MRSDRFRVAGSILTFVVVSALAAGAAAQGPVNVSMKALPITVTAGDYQLVNQVLDLPPGAAAPKHSHPGPVVVTILAGELTVMDAAGEHVVKAGESLTEKPGDVHSVVNKGSTTTRVVAAYLVPKGAELMTPAK